MNVVLMEPEIAANTGNIARLCVVAGCRLHLVRPLGFFLTDTKLRRAALDYWDALDLTVHDSFEDFLASVSGRVYLVETKGAKLYSAISYRSSDYLVFGSETRGIPESILASFAETHISVPMIGTRSLNLANTVAIAVYEAWRQRGFSWGLLGE